MSFFEIRKWSPFIKTCENASKSINFGRILNIIIDIQAAKIDIVQKILSVKTMSLIEKINKILEKK